MNDTQWMLKSKIGPIYFVASKTALRGVYFDRQKAPMVKSLTGSDPTLKILARAARQVEEYLDGRRREFDLPLEAEGTEFQQRVWRELRRIPYGKTLSYGDVARRIKKDKAVRAVGSANGRNPLCIIVPCHRVIAAGGKLGGYAGGLALKKKLLQIENARLG